MKRLLSLPLFVVLSLSIHARTILVANVTELNNAQQEAKPGDTIILRNGEWKNVALTLTCSGVENRPVVFRAETAGNVVVTGLSHLEIGGNYLVVEGLYFRNGYAGSDPVISFRASKNQLANHCRVTQCMVNDFNNPKRMQENYWVAFYGKNNRLDHCNFIDKKNMGVLLAVLLDDDRSRQNFHQIDHNYFGRRIPLASNSGEIIRVGVSQHCQFNSNTQITDNFFEECDGETEIVSIKSGSNRVSGNYFLRCQGSVVLRHGDNNTVDRNVFNGSGKTGTGGVRIINRGQWVVNNLFLECRGTGFRSPLSIMNGIPNSPAHRYVQVTDAVVANNTWFNCAPASFCEGSDTERTLPPQNVYLLNNNFYNDRDTSIYRAFDKIGGLRFSGNYTNKQAGRKSQTGLTTAAFSFQKMDGTGFPVAQAKPVPPGDSLQGIAGQRLHERLPLKNGFAGKPLAQEIIANSYTRCGTNWFNRAAAMERSIPSKVSAANTVELQRYLHHKSRSVIQLTGSTYHFTEPLVIDHEVILRCPVKSTLQWTSAPLVSLFIITGRGSLTLEDISIDGRGVQSASIIATDTAGPSNHYQFAMSGCSISHLPVGIKTFFTAGKSIVADSIVLRNNHFDDIHGSVLFLASETDNKGYYPVEHLVISGNDFKSIHGRILDLYRGGNDESTLGPNLLLEKNRFDNCQDPAGSLIRLAGVQHSSVFDNQFLNCNEAGTILFYEDWVRAEHLLSGNRVEHSGRIITNKYVQVTDVR